MRDADKSQKHIIQGSTSELAYRAKKMRQKPKHIINAGDMIKSIGMLMLSSAIGYGFWHLGMSESNIIMMYILGVLITSVITTYQVYSLVASAISVFVFNFFFDLFGPFRNYLYLCG